MAKQGKSLPSKPRLGRGLSSLINNSVQTAPPVEEQGEAREAYRAEPPAESKPAGRPLSIPLKDISPNPYQPRRKFNAEHLAELADSIRQQGVLQPLVVAECGDGEARPYVLIAGERRLRAAEMAGLDAVPCVLKEASRRQMLEWALIENIQREDLNPVERAQAYQDYMDRFSLTQAEAGERLGIARATIANHLRLLDLSDECQQMLLDGLLTFGHAKVLAGLALPLQLRLARRAAGEALSVRQLEQLAQKAHGRREDAPPRQAPGKAPYLVDVENQLSQAVGTKVAVVPGRSKNTGRIVIDFYGLDDFDRIVERLGARLDS